ncbi:MAG: fibrobacter succinogenes major paralogous domain-containing protein [Bacteroidales bacterium]|nr:fibrobacter succinogenes major paralogous domain-containing protein [Bacteroidales bacterium]
MKRTILTSAFLFFFCFITFSQAPATFKYQGVLRDANGNIRANEDITVDISIMPSSGGAVAYSESHSVKTNGFGLFTLEIGSKYKNMFANNIDWSGSTYSLTIEINGQLYGTSDILSVPVARYAETAGSADYNYLTNKPALSTVATSGSYNDLSNKPDFADVATSGSYTDLSDKPALSTVATSGNYNDLSNKPELASVATSGSYTDLSEKPELSNVATSGNYNDLANKPANLVTTDGTQTISGAKTFSSSIVANAGINSNNQKITNVGNPTASSDAVNKTYADGLVTNMVSTTGNQSIGGTKTFTSAIVANAGINSNNQKINNVGTPATNGDATNKAYVDSTVAALMNIIMDLNQGVNDIDGNNYKVVMIGDQLWMAEDLKVHKLNDGTTINNFTGNSGWGSMASTNHLYATASVYTFYSLFSVNSGKLCPSDWHIPTKDEYQEMVDYLGGSAVAGYKIKSTSGWYSNTGHTNQTGFTALPTSYIISTTGNWNTATGSSYYGYWWTTTTSDETHNWYFYLGPSSAPATFQNSYTNVNGFSVRCVKD